MAKEPKAVRVQRAVEAKQGHQRLEHALGQSLAQAEAHVATCSTKADEAKAALAGAKDAVKALKADIEKQLADSQKLVDKAVEDADG